MRLTGCYCGNTGLDDWNNFLLTYICFISVNGELFSSVYNPYYLSFILSNKLGEEILFNNIKSLVKCSYVTCFGINN